MLSRNAAACLLLVTASSACSNWAMHNDSGFSISARTMDVGTQALPRGIQWGVMAMPKGTPLPPDAGCPVLGGSTKHAILGFTVLNNSRPTPLSVELINGAMNDAGLTCDLQTLLGSKYPAKTGNASVDLDVASFCTWALASFSTAMDVKAALDANDVVVFSDAEFNDDSGAHFSLRDSTHSIVVEFIERKTKVYVDGNDNGNSGFGIMTNEPPWPWQVQNVKHFMWKKSMPRSGATVPGNWYPDERFLRIHQVKSGMPVPKSYAEAISQTVQVLNTVTVPFGEQMGTDSGHGEGAADYTNWGVIYDHKQRILYWRTQTNQNLQRLRFEDAFAGTHGKLAFLPVMPNTLLPYFHDAAHALKTYA